MLSDTYMRKLALATDEAMEIVAFVRGRVQASHGHWTMEAQNVITRNVIAVMAAKGVFAGRQK